MGKCQHDAGVLKDNEISPAAKQKFIDDVKAALLFGTDGAPKLPIPCGPEFPAVPFADRIELEDEQQYPEWHAYAIGLYRDIARALDYEGQFTILPICCPISLGFALGIDVPDLDFPGEFALIGFALPLLAIHLNIIPPVDLTLKFPDLLKVGLPSIEIPEFPLPQLEFPELFTFAFPFPKFPDMLLGLMVKMPSLFLKLLSFDFSAPCDVVLDSELFGGFNVNEAIVWAVTQKVLAAKTAECLSIALVGTTVGSSPAGITGHLGSDVYGYEPPEQELGEKAPIRDRIVSYAESGNGLAWSKDFADFESKGMDIEEANLKYTNFLVPNWIFPQPPETPFNRKNMLIRLNTAFGRAQKQSCCGMFVRACYYYAGATYHPFFTEPYEPASAVLRLSEIAKANGAVIEQVRADNGAPRMPALKRGDSIIIQSTTANPADPEAGSEHVLMFVEDYPGGNDGTVRVIEGGQADYNNPQAPNGTAINEATYEFSVAANGTLTASPIGTPDPRSVIFIMNGWSMVTARPKEEEGTEGAPT